jgi:hypothetical protein
MVKTLLCRLTQGPSTALGYRLTSLGMTDLASCQLSPISHERSAIDYAYGC